MRSVWVWALVAVMALVGSVLSFLLWREPALLGVRAGSEAQSIWLWIAVGTTVLTLLTTLGYRLTGNQIGRSVYRRNEDGDDAGEVSPTDAQQVANVSRSSLTDLRLHLRTNIAFFWRHKVRLLLVVGEAEQIEAIAPGLAAQQWLEGEDTVLLWGGSVQGEPAARLIEQWRQLCPRRPLDGIVWALSPEQSATAEHIGNGIGHLHKVMQLLRWQAPVHLWEVRVSQWDQSKRPTEAVGCLLAPSLTPEQLESRLGRLELPLRELGLAQMQQDITHDFLLRLSHELKTEGIARWKQAVAPLLRARGVALRGLWFSLPLPAPTGGVKHAWQVAPVWRGVLNDRALCGRPHGWTLPRAGAVLPLGVAAL